MGNRLYVGNLAVQVTADDLSTLFAGAGKVVSAHLVVGRATGRGKGFAFVEMAEEDQAQHAIALYNGHHLYEQALIVSEARPTAYEPVNTRSSPTPRFREIKHKRRGGADRNRIN